MGILSSISMAKEKFRQRRETRLTTQNLKDRLDLQYIKEERKKAKEREAVKSELRQEKQELRDIQLAPVKRFAGKLKRGYKGMKQAQGRMRKRSTGEGLGTAARRGSGGSPFGFGGGQKESYSFGPSEKLHTKPKPKQKSIIINL